MNKFLGLSALAVALAGVPTQEASASGINFCFGAGLSFSFDGGGWGGGHHGHGGHRQQYMYIFPEPYQLYGDAQHHSGSPQSEQPYKPFPPPPAREKGTQEQTIHQHYINAPRYNYPNLGYSIYQPTRGYGYPQYYHAPALRFDQ
jgi:hypothetical protein